MGLAVPLLVGGCGEAEVGAEVDEVPDAVDQVGDEALRLAVREGQEDEVEAVEGRGVERVEGQVRVGGGERRVQVGDRGAGLTVPGGGDDLEVRVGGEQAEQLGAGVARPAHDPRTIRHDAYHTPWCIATWGGYRGKRLPARGGAVSG